MLSMQRVANMDSSVAQRHPLIFSDDIAQEPFYKYFYPYEVEMLLPIDGTNDFYHLIGSKRTNECFDDDNDFNAFIRNDLSASTSNSEDIPVSEQNYVFSDMDTILNCRLANTRLTGRKMVLLRDIAHYAIYNGEDEELSDLKRTKRLEFIREYCKEVKRKRFAKQYKRFTIVRAKNLVNPQDEAAEMLALELTEKDMDRLEQTARHQSPDFQRLAQVRRKAVTRKYEKYAISPVFRKRFRNRVYHNVNADVPAEDSLHISRHSGRIPLTPQLKKAPANDESIYATPQGRLMADDASDESIYGTPDAPDAIAQPSTQSSLIYTPLSAQHLVEFALGEADKPRAQRSASSAVRGAVANRLENTPTGRPNVQKRRPRRIGDNVARAHSEMDAGTPKVGRRKATPRRIYDAVPESDSRFSLQSALATPKRSANVGPSPASNQLAVEVRRPVNDGSAEADGPDNASQIDERDLLLSSTPATTNQLPVDVRRRGNEGPNMTNSQTDGWDNTTQFDEGDERNLLNARFKEKRNETHSTTCREAIWLGDITLTDSMDVHEDYEVTMNKNRPLQSTRIGDMDSSSVRLSDIDSSSVRLSDVDSSSAESFGNVLSSTQATTNQLPVDVRRRGNEGPNMTKSQTDGLDNTTQIDEEDERNLLNARFKEKRDVTHSTTSRDAVWLGDITLTDSMDVHEDYEPTLNKNRPLQSTRIGDMDSSSVRLSDIDSSSAESFGNVLSSTQATTNELPVDVRRRGNEGPNMTNSQTDGWDNTTQIDEEDERNLLNARFKEKRDVTHSTTCRDAVWLGDITLTDSMDVHEDYEVTMNKKRPLQSTRIGDIDSSSTDSLQIPNMAGHAMFSSTPATIHDTDIGSISSLDLLDLATEMLQSAVRDLVPYRGKQRPFSNIQVTSGPQQRSQQAPQPTRSIPTIQVQPSSPRSPTTSPRRQIQFQPSCLEVPSQFQKAVTRNSRKVTTFIAPNGAREVTVSYTFREPVVVSQSDNTDYSKPIIIRNVRTYF